MTIKAKKNNSMSMDEFTRMFLAVQSVTIVARANGRNIKTSDDYEEYVELVAEMEDFEVDKLLKSLEKKKQVAKPGKKADKVSKSKGKSEKDFKKLEVISNKKDDESSSIKVKEVKDTEKNTANANNEKSKVVDKTSMTEESEVKTLKVDLNKVVNLEVKENKDIEEIKVAKDTAEKENKKSLDKQISSREKIEAVVEEEKNFFSGKRNDVFEIKITYSSGKSEFNGIQLSEDEMKGGNMQIGFYVNDGEFTDTPVKNVRRKRAKKAKDEYSDSAVQISFV